MTAPKQKKAGKKKLEARNDLIGEYSGYVRSLAVHLIRKMGLPMLVLDDFVSAGYFGLVEAADRFDFNKGDDFKKYAFFRIRGSMIDCLRGQSELSGENYRRARALEAAHDLKSAKEEAEARGDAAGSQNAGERLAEVLEYATRASLAYRMSITDPGVEQEVSEPQAGDNAENSLIKLQGSEQFRKFVATLPEKERIVIEGYYFDDKSFQEIVDENSDLSKSWVSRLHARALERIRKWVLSNRREMQSRNQK